MLDKNNKTFTAIIPARGDSKRLVSKNIRTMIDKPLVAWTIESAIKSGIFKTIWLNSEDENILSVGSYYNIGTYKRPLELGSDYTSTEAVIREQLSNMTKTVDYVMVLQPTSPTRKVSDIVKFAELAGDYVLSSCNMEFNRNGSIYVAPWDYMLYSIKWVDSVRLVTDDIDIDTIKDWEIAECFLKERQSV